MKKILIPILLVSYLAFSSGVMVNFHYCMNRLASMEFFAIKGERCGECGMNIHKSHGCCRDEVKIVKMDDDQKISQEVNFQLPSLDQQVVLPSEFIIASFHNVQGKRQHQNHSPPLLNGQDAYLQNRVFRI